MTWAGPSAGKPQEVAGSDLDVAAVDGGDAAAGQHVEELLLGRWRWVFGGRVARLDPDQLNAKIAKAGGFAQSAV
jgi:hypothetical protein